MNESTVNGFHHWISLLWLQYCYTEDDSIEADFRHLQLMNACLEVSKLEELFACGKGLIQ